MRTPLKILLTGLLLVLVVALGTEVAALHRNALPALLGPPVVVRKSAAVATVPKTVRRLVAGPRQARPFQKRICKLHQNAPAE